MKIISVLIILFFSTFTFAQKEEKCACSKKDKAKVRQYFAELNEKNKFIAECEQQTKSTNRKPIAGGCEWGGNGCPVNIVKPDFPQNAKTLKISGTVKVEVIIDENGLVIYSKMIEGNKIFKKSAERAACKSKFTPFIFCGKRFKHRVLIEYNFSS